MPPPRQHFTGAPTELPWPRAHKAPGYDCLFHAPAPPVQAPMPAAHTPPVHRTHNAILWSAALVVLLVGISLGLALGLRL